MTIPCVIPQLLHEVCAEGHISNFEAFEWQHLAHLRGRSCKMYCRASLTAASSAAVDVVTCDHFTLIVTAAGGMTTAAVEVVDDTDPSVNICLRSARLL